jgi:hypothetical protein
LAHLTDEIYAYEAENNAYGKGIAIQYGTKSFWYSPSSQMLLNAPNNRITTRELNEAGNQVIAQQLNELIALALKNKEGRTEEEF